MPDACAADNKVGDKGASSLGEALKINTTLEILDLYGARLWHSVATCTYLLDYCPTCLAYRPEVGVGSSVGVVA